MSGYNLRSRKRIAPVALNDKPGADLDRNMDGRTYINELPDMVLAQIFEKLPWQERLKIEQVSKKWQHVGTNFSWSNYRMFDNDKYRDWSDELVMEQIKPFFDRCGRHLRHLKFSRWSPETVLSFIRMAPNVQHLNFYYVKLNDESLNELAGIVPNLKSLDFETSLRSFERVTDDGLTECFKEMTCLEYLYMFDCDALFGQRPFVQFPPNLKFFSLHIDLKNIDQILNWIAKGCKELRGLYISWFCSVNENGFQAISQMKSLSYLDVTIDDADKNDVGYVFGALTELRAIEINTVNEKVIASIARYCQKLEHLSINSYSIEISPEEHANILRVASLPNLCSLEMWIESYSKEQVTELVNRLIANGKLQYIRLKIKDAPLEPEILFEMLRRCKSIRSVALTFRRIEYSDLYSKVCQVVNEIDESERQQREFTGEDHPIVEVQYQCGFVGNLSAQYKWLRFKNLIPYRPSAASNKWQHGWLSARIPDWVI